MGIEYRRKWEAKKVAEIKEEICGSANGNIELSDKRKYIESEHRLDVN